MRRFLALLPVVFWVSLSPCLAAAIYVPGDYSSIQEAINAAVDGDEISVGPGTYVENLNFLGKEIRVASSSGAEVTIIDGSSVNPDDPDNRYGSVATFMSGEGPGAVLQGFTLTGGVGFAYPLGAGGGYRVVRSGGGIFIYGSSPQILDNIIIKNEVHWGCGGGINAHLGSPLVRGNVISSNKALYGGGVYLGMLCNGIVENNVISGNIGFNGAGGVRLSAYAATILRNNVIVHNETERKGGGLYAPLGNAMRLSIYGNTICFNKAGTGAGIYNPGSVAPFPECIANCIIWGNEATNGRPSDLVGVQARAVVCCDIGDGTYAGLNGNISVDPGFVDAAGGDFRLLPDSPCIDAGNNGAATGTDIDGYPRVADGDSDRRAVVDMGAFEYWPAPPPEFIRGDVNDDGSIDIADGITLLDALFGDSTLSCADAADANDDGKLDIADPTYILEVLFGESSSSPGMCGRDLTYDELGCESYKSCP